MLSEDSQGACLVSQAKVPMAPCSQGARGLEAESDEQALGSERAFTIAAFPRAEF